VSPHVRYGMPYLLIRDVVGSVPCSDEWKIGVVTRVGSHGARGVMVPLVGIVTRSGLPRETLALQWYCDYLN
jgi:hypothetical protein